MAAAVDEELLEAAGDFGSEVPEEESDFAGEASEPEPADSLFAESELEPESPLVSLPEAAAVEERSEEGLLSVR